MKKRLIDLALEVLIATILVGGFLFYLSRGGKVNGPLVSAVLNTAVVFGLLISWFRLAWAEVRFWLAIFAMLVLHIVAYTQMWRSTGLKFPTANFALIDTVEAVLFAFILDRLTAHIVGSKSESEEQ